jgi:hypothetical protein
MKTRVLSPLEGSLGIYKGFITNTIELTAYHCVFFMFLEQDQTNYEERTTKDHLISLECSVGFPVTL